MTPLPRLVLPRALAALTVGVLAASLSAGTATAAAPEASAAPAAKAANACKFRPGPGNTGAHGVRQDRGTTSLRSGQTLENANVSSLEIRGSGITVRNVRVSGNIFVTPGSSKVRIVRSTAQGIGISSASRISVVRSDIGFSSDDAIHVTSDAGSLVRGVKLRYNYIHDPRVTNGAHYDGTQVRGVHGMLIECSTYRAGPYQSNFNAGVYLENANGGDSNVTVHHNWIFGYAFSVMVDAESATFTANRVRDPHWRACYLGNSSGSGGFESSGNMALPSHRHVSLCGQG
ncbi:MULTISPECIES: right-handed parallel beta-helix repeat-containing protein [unclassified Nocardioides]|uniref:right-handed parallel beta-helix repeat-containing protein n=1 Tax=unclassified Nocardioides TaxID=2615069 RepID=UPI00360CA369